MHIIPTLRNLPGRIYVSPITVPFKTVSIPGLTTIPGLTSRYTMNNDDCDSSTWEHPYNPGYSPDGPSEFSADDQDILNYYFQKRLQQKDKIVIVEIGVCRNEYHKTSTSILMDNKRDSDIYIGIDIEDKSYLNNHSKNIYTLKTRSEDFTTVYNFFKRLGITEIDFFMIDGWHSVNQVYAEWTYTQMLASQGIVAFHDTNAHPGPICVLASIDTKQYDVYKYFTDIQDWGIGIAVKKE